jgi:hypothetical protein
VELAEFGSTAYFHSGVIVMDASMTGLYQVTGLIAS